MREGEGVGSKIFDLSVKVVGWKLKGVKEFG